MNKNELWQIFMKTGKVSDYLNYKNAKELYGAYPVCDEEVSEEFSFDAEENAQNGYYPSEEYEDDNQYGRFDNT